MPICRRRLMDKPDGSGPSDARSIRAGDTKKSEQLKSQLEEEDAPAPLEAFEAARSLIIC